MGSGYGGLMKFDRRRISWPVFCFASRVPDAIGAESENFERNRLGVEGVRNNKKVLSGWLVSTYVCRERGLI